MTRTDRAQFWSKHLARQRCSGLPQRAYCAKHGLAVSSFGYWRRKLRAPADADVIGAEAAPHLIPVEFIAETAVHCAGLSVAGSGVQMHTGAVRIELAVGFDVPTLRRALEALGC